MVHCWLSLGSKQSCWFHRLECQSDRNKIFEHRWRQPDQGERCGENWFVGLKIPSTIGVRMRLVSFLPHPFPARSLPLKKWWLHSNYQTRRSVDQLVSDDDVKNRINGWVGCQSVHHERLFPFICGLKTDPLALIGCDVWYSVKVIGVCSQEGPTPEGVHCQPETTKRTVSRSIQELQGIWRWWE